MRAETSPETSPKVLFCETCGEESDGAFNVNHYSRTGLYLGVFCAPCWESYIYGTDTPIPYELTESADRALNPWHGYGTLGQRHGCQCRACWPRRARAPRLRDVLIARAETDMTDHESGGR